MMLRVGVRSVTKQSMQRASMKNASVAASAAVATTISSNTNTLTNHGQYQFQNSYSYLYQVNSFSTSSQMKLVNDDDDDDDVLIMPSNLKLDPRAVSSPFYGLEKIQPSTATVEQDDDDDDDDDDEEDEKDDVTNSKENEVDNDTDEEYDEGDYDEDDDDDKQAIYSLANKPEPIYAIPLPQRLHVPIFDLTSGTEAGTIHLSESIFGHDPIRTDILHRCVTYQRNKKRGLRNNGARTKTISEISGSGKKVRAQKGGGVARAGHKRPAHWRGGAKAHGPKGNDQNYETKLNKKVRKMGIRMALSQKLKEGNLTLVNSFSGLESYKTKVLATALGGLADIGGRFGCTAYVIDHVPVEEEEDADGTLKAVSGVHINLQVASGNMLKVKTRNQQFVNVYDMLKYEKLVLSLSALQALEERYGEKY